MARTRQKRYDERNKIWKELNQKKKAQTQKTENISNQKTIQTS